MGSSRTYYYAVKNCGFKPRPFRTDGTYTKYVGLDDKVECVNFYTIYIKFGIGRTTYDVSQDLRNDHISLDEAKLFLIKNMMVNFLRDILMML